MTDNAACVMHYPRHIYVCGGAAYVCVCLSALIPAGRLRWNYSFRPYQSMQQMVIIDEKVKMIFLKLVFYSYETM